MKLVNLGDVYVERDALNIARRINEYDENLRIQYLESEAKLDQPPYRLVEKCKDGLDRIVFTFWELDERILNRIFRADTQRNNILGGLDEKNALASLAAKQRYEEKVEETKDIVAHIIAAPKSKYTVTHEGREMTFYDDRPADVKEVD
jgi:IS5 family transposase